MSRRRRFYEPEDLGRDQDRRDAEDPGRRFYAYVLDTDYGHYVGHTFNVDRRLRKHQGGESKSTAGSNPTLAWSSAPLATRTEAASFEAALKSLRDGRKPRFREITGLEPIPFAAPALGQFSGPRSSPFRRRSRARRQRRSVGRFLAREFQSLFRSRRKRRMWGAIVLAGVLVWAYVRNGGF